MDESEESKAGVEVSRQFKFATLCECLDRIRHIPSKGKIAKQRVFCSLITKWSSLSDGSSEGNGPKASFYPALRLVANAYDSRKFNMKSKKLISKVCKSLLLPDDTKKELFNTDSRSSSLALAQLSREIADRNPSSRDATVFQVNDSLDRIMDAELSDDELNTLLRGCPSAREIFWLMNILIRNVERCLGVACSTLMNWVHESGNDMRQAGTSIEKICELTAQGRTSDDSSILYRMFEPMLLSRLKHGVDVYQKLVQHCGDQFYVELKFDGEHFLLHHGAPGQYRYYSRHQNDFSDKIGGILDARIDPFFAPTLRSCILDAELLLWDTVDHKYVGKGRMASDGRVHDVKSLNDRGVVQSCLAVFDVLFLNGRSLMNVPLHRRKALLQDGSILQRQDKNVIFVADYETVSSRQQFVEIYEKAMRNEEEGVVAKKMDSVYKVGVRHMVNGWFKVKPFHVGEESLDLAVVGVDRGRNGYISDYVVAVLRDDKFFIVGKVSRGLDDPTRKRLKNKLERDHGWLSGKVIPDWIHSGYTSADRASDYVHKDNIQVVEVRAAGIINNRLQFPSLRFYREDKYVRDADKYDDFLDFEKNLREQSVANVEKEQSKAVNHKRKIVPKVMAEYRLASKQPRVQRVSSDLQGKQICILHANANASLQDIKQIVESFGANTVANPRSETAFVLSGEAKNLRTKSVIKSNKYNVVSTDWAVRCRDAKTVLPISKSEIIHLVDASLLPDGDDMELQDGEEEIREYTPEEVTDMLEDIDTTQTVDKIDEDTLRSELLKDEKFLRFSGLTFYLDESLPQSRLQYTRVLLKMHAAKVNEVLDKHVTHVVVENAEDEIGKWKRAAGTNRTVVDMDWIETAIERE